jgi:hypothetical protein
LRCGSARSWPTKWWRSAQTGCISGWGSSPWNERTESRMPGESNFLVTTHSHSIKAVSLNHVRCELLATATLSIWSSGLWPRVVCSKYQRLGPNVVVQWLTIHLPIPEVSV